VAPELVRLGFCGQIRIIYSYPVVLIVGAALAIVLGVVLARRDGVAPWDTISVGLLAIAGGIVGATLLDVAVNLRRYLETPWPPGMVFFGGLAGGAIASLLFIWRFRVPLGPLADAAAPSLALGHAVGRIGCLLAGCCYGRRVSGPWPGLVFGDERAPATALSLGVHPLHPVQLYEAAGLTVLMLALLLARRWRRLRGRVFPLYLVGYGALRLCTELGRGDPQRGAVGPLSTSQLIALCAIVVGAVGLGWRRPVGQNSRR
jgi:phosphatidylglycerol---prolipoprotein diacylglyceryl transferase